MSIHLPRLDVLVCNTQAIASASAMLQLPPADLYQKFLMGRETEDVAIAARALIDHVLEGGLQGDMAIPAWRPLDEAGTLDHLKEELSSNVFLTNLFPQLRSEQWQAVFHQAMLPVSRSAGRWLDTVSQPATQPCEHANALLRQRLRLPLDRMKPLHPRELAPSFSADEVWLIGCFYLALGMYGSTYFPEIVATEWAYRWIALQAAREVDSDQSMAQMLYDCANEAYLAYDRSLQALSQQMEDKQAESIRLRMRHAARVVATLELRATNFCAETASRLCMATPSVQVAELIAHVAPMTGRHHQKVKLGDRSLADRFTDPNLDARALVTDLERSPFVRLNAQGSCPLLNGLKFGGSMFGVFSADQHALLKRWIDRIDASKEVTPGIAQPSMSIPSRAGDIKFAPKGLEDAGPQPVDQRELLFQLVNIENHPYLLAHAATIVELGLERGRKLQLDPRPGKYTFPQFFDYSANELSRRIEEIYRNLLVEPYLPLKDVPDREEVIFQQMTAMLGNLIDGAWLTNVQPHDQGLGYVRARLNEIYIDEMGRGEVAKNHIQLIYGVLQSMEVTLPHVASPEFIDQCELPDTVYPFAIHQLALSLFPRECLPEIVGYNLAIEMFGLGELRMHEVQKLRHHGFDTSYEEVHLSIDNMATGHARSSLQLTIDYLDSIRAQMGEASCQSVWRRVWDGYAYFAQFVERERASQRSAVRPAELLI